MTRPLRIEFKGAVYHITSRGNTIQTIFLDIKKLGGDIKSDISRPDPLIIDPLIIIEKIKIISPTKLKEVPPGQITGKEPYFHLPGLEVIEKGTCSSCKGAMLAAMRRLSRERRSPSCTILMGQRVREREDKFAFNLKSTKPLVGIGQCCSWVVDNYQSEQIKGCPVRAEAIYRYLRKIS